MGITPTIKNFTGDKIKIDRVVNREITVHAFKMEPSKFTEKGNGKRLDLQISLSGTMHVVFSGSVVLMEMIEKVPKDDFPFITTIEKINDHYEFT